MPTLDHHGASLYYEVHGEGQPLLCIMGLGGNIHFWEFQIAAFAKRYRTIAFDNRGAGRSDKPPGPYTIQMLADDAIAVLDAVGVARAHVVGISMGGMIAQDLVLRYPERVGALVLAATLARPDDGTRSVAEAGAAQMGTPSPLQMIQGARAMQGGGFDLSTVDVKQLFRFMMSLILTPDFIHREKEWLRSLLERAQQYGFSVEAFLAQVAAVMNHDAAERLKDVKAPTLVLTGDADLLVPPHHSDELARLIPGAQLVKIAGGTHGFNVERKDEFNKVVLDFLTQHQVDPFGALARIECVSEPEQKALAFNSVAREVRALAGSERFERLLFALPQETRALLERPPLPIEWLPYTHSFALVRKAHEIVFGNEERRTAEVGRRAVLNDLNVVHKMFIRFASPEFVLARAARLWKSYWRNNGWVDIQRVGPGQVHVCYQGLQHATPLFWAVQAGTLRGLAEATGIPDVMVKILDGKNSQSSCVVGIWW